MPWPPPRTQELLHPSGVGRTGRGFPPAYEERGPLQLANDRGGAEKVLARCPQGPTQSCYVTLGKLTVPTEMLVVSQMGTGSCSLRPASLGLDSLARVLAEPGLLVATAQPRMGHGAPQQASWGPFLLPLLLGSESTFSGPQPPPSSHKGPCDSPTSFSLPVSPPLPPSISISSLPSLFTINIYN